MGAITDVTGKDCPAMTVAYQPLPPNVGSDSRSATCHMPGKDTMSKPLGVRGSLTALLTLTALASAFSVVVAVGPAYAATPAAVVGMPFGGQWAYNTNVNPTYTDQNSSHPSVHASPGGGDWATDLYAPVNTDVKLKVTGVGGALGFAWISTSNGTCGQRTQLKVTIGGTDVGWLYFEHLNNAVKSGAITNGMTLGKVADWGSCNAGHHVHIEFKNLSGNHSCYVDNGHPGVTLNEGDNLGVLGSVNGGTRQQCSSIPSDNSPPPAADSDSDGTPDSQDRCPRYSGPANNRGCPLAGHSVTGNFNGDAYTDIVSFFDEGNDSVSAWLFSGTGTGISHEQMLWSTGQGQWNWSNSTFVAGDFNGDGKDDVIGFYDYGNDNLGVWLFPGTGSGIGHGQFLWSTGPGQWNMRNSQFYVGNFNGDGYVDVLSLYDYGTDEMGTWLFPGNAVGLGTPQGQWRTGQGQWNMKNAKVVVGNFNGDTNLDLLAFYNYGGDNLGTWLFPGNGNGVSREQFLSATGNGQWNWNNSTFLAGHFSGADPYDDVIAFYDYGSDNLGTWLFPGTATGLGTRQFKWSTGNGQWNMTNTKLVVGNVTTDTNSDVVAFYNYGSANLGAWIFAGSGDGVSHNVLNWTTGNGMWDWPNM